MKTIVSAKETGHKEKPAIIFNKIMDFSTSPMRAVNSGNASALRDLINNGVIRSTDIEALLSSACLVNKAMEMTELLLIHCIQKNYTDIISEYIMNPLIEEKYKYSFNLFAEAARYQTPDGFKMMVAIIQAGYSLAYNDYRGLSTLSLLTSMEKQNTNAILLFGVTTDFSEYIIDDSRGYNELDCTVRSGDVKKLYFLLSNINHHSSELLTTDRIKGVMTNISKLDFTSPGSKEMYYLLERFFYIASGYKSNYINSSLAEYLPEQTMQELHDLIENYCPSAWKQLLLTPFDIVSEVIDGCPSNTSFSITSLLQQISTLQEQKEEKEAKEDKAHTWHIFVPQEDTVMAEMDCAEHPKKVKMAGVLYEPIWES